MRIDPITELLGAMLCTPKGPRVLMYHSLGCEDNTSRWSVSIARFKDQMRYLYSHGWTALRVCDLVYTETIPDRSVVITFDDGYMNNYEYGFPLISELGMCATWFVVSSDIGKMSGWHDPGVPPQKMMNVQQLREMRSKGMEIGAHSRHHVDLTDLDDANRLEEIAGSRTDLENLLGCPISSFSYPYGRYDSKTTKIVQESGFTAGVTTNPGSFSGQQNHFMIPRIGVFCDDDSPKFARKLSLANTEVSWPHIIKKLLNQIRPRKHRGQNMSIIN
jgi:peptidoglycan/xylan/chitin deacetylase (PgdA/CDA1 family)